MNQVVTDFSKADQEGWVPLTTVRAISSLKDFTPIQGEIVLLVDEDREVEAVLERNWSRKNKGYFWAAKFDLEDVIYTTPMEPYD